MKWYDFSEIIQDKTSGNPKLKVSEYKDKGEIPVIDQGKRQISGYSDDDTLKYNYNKPLIIFGDHTCIFKYIDSPFILGADGVKALEIKIDADTKFIYYFLKTAKIPDTGYDRHFKYLKRIKIPLPPLETQKKIAAILDKADELRRNDQKILEKYDQLAQSVFLEMFGDPVTNEKGWKRMRGTQISKMITVGVVIKPASYYVNKGIPALRSQNVKPNYFDLNKLVYFTEEVNDFSLSKSKLKLNDIVVVRTGQPGTAAYIKDAQVGYNCIDLIIIRPDLEIIHPEYLCRFFNSEGGRDIVLGTQRGQIQKHFNIGEVKKCSIPIPPIDNQLSFVKKINSIEIQKQITQESLQKSEALFQNLLQGAFKGELLTNKTLL